MEEIAQNADVAALCETGWVTREAVAKIAVVREKPTSIVYGPLPEMPVEPTVILLRLNGKQQMLLHDAWPGLRFEGKPQCHIVAIAKESGEIAVSVGCMLSRVRTGMSNNEVTCAISSLCRGRFQAFRRRCLQLKCSSVWCASARIQPARSNILSGKLQ
jgi:uncharacterized protein (DUF169 family)